MPGAVNHRFHILVVEDDLATRTMLVAYFEDAGYRVTEAASGAEFRAALKQHHVDLILLDINLPDEDGLDLLRQLRRSSDVAVILVSANTAEVDRILGLELGAHDYVTKPFNTRELLARVKNLIRLTQGRLDTTRDPGDRCFDEWMLINKARRLVSPLGNDVPLTRGEFDLLAAFVSNAGRVMTRDSLLDHVSHRDWAPSDRTIDVLVGRIRRKIEDDPKNPKRLMTVHSVGYIFTPTVSDTARMH